MEIVARLKATKAFLAGVQGTKGFDHVLSMQAANVDSMLDNIRKIDLDSAAEMVGLIKECGWSDDTVAKLLGKVGTGVSKAEVADQLHTYQDFRAMKHYFTEEEWTQLLGPQSPENKQEIILVRVRDLGGIKLGESSMSDIAALVLATTVSIDKAMSHMANDKFEFYKHVKDQIKAHKGLRMGPWVLPLKPLKYPDKAIIMRIYGDAGPVSCPLDMSKLTALASSIPCRSTSKLLRESPMSSSTGTASKKGQGQMADFAQMMQTMMASMMGSPQSSGGLRIIAGGRRSRKALAFSPETGSTGIPALENGAETAAENREEDDAEGMRRRRGRPRSHRPR